MTVGGPDAIYLAGRTDFVIPPANLPWPGGLIRHGGPTWEEALETMPSLGLDDKWPTAAAAATTTARRHRGQMR